jgi:hypothetical protein
MMNNKTPKDIDEHVRRYPMEVQRLLTQMRLTTKKAAPQATEKISYGIPTFALDGKPFDHADESKAPHGRTNREARTTWRAAELLLSGGVGILPVIAAASARWRRQKSGSLIYTSAVCSGCFPRNIEERFVGQQEYAFCLSDALFTLYDVAGLASRSGSTKVSAAVFRQISEQNQVPKARPAI